MSRIFTTLTRAQVYRAFLLASHHNHGWAEQLRRVGVSAHSDRQIGIRYSPSPEETVELAEKLEHATAAQLAAWDLVLRAIVTGQGDVADQDLETFALTGSETWPAPMRSGIWSPGVSDTGKSYHTTGTGRLSWSIDRAGRVELEVCRPGGPLFSVQSWAGCSPAKGGTVQAALDAVSPPAERASSRSSAEANILRDRIAGALVAQGFSVVFGEDVEELGGGGPDLVLSIEPAGKDSIVVLQASVNAEGFAVVHQLRAGAHLNLRHVAALSKVLSALGSQWDPEVELA